MKIIAIIPARLKSTRLNKKLLIKFKGLEMIEHVRRRAILSQAFHNVYVATGDEEIEDLIKRNNGNVIKTFQTHENGTLRAAEAIKSIEASHIVLIQGDEPLILPEHLQKIVAAIKAKPNYDVWNLTAKLDQESHLDDCSQVKCSINEEDQILYCFRRSPSYLPKIKQMNYIRKMLGVIGYKKEILEAIPTLRKSMIEKLESIEQMRLISNNLSINSIEVDECLPSVNVNSDINLILNCIKDNSKQQRIINNILN